jgi:hypothetical protein
MAAALRSTGSRSQEEPQYEPENRKHNDDYGPNDFSFGAGIALKNVHDCPHIGNQDKQTP